MISVVMTIINSSTSYQLKNNFRKRNWLLTQKTNPHNYRGQDKEDFHDKTLTKRSISGSMGNLSINITKWNEVTIRIPSGRHRLLLTASHRSSQATDLIIGAITMAPSHSVRGKESMHIHTQPCNFDL